MNSYTIETVLETREPGVIELFGNAPGVVHKVSGVVHLHVDKTIHLKELSVVFLCEGILYTRITITLLCVSVHILSNCRLLTFFFLVLFD